MGLSIRALLTPIARASRKSKISRMGSAHCTGLADHHGCTDAQVESRASYERPAIIDRDRNRFPVLRIYHDEPVPNGKCAMRRREPVRIEALTTRGVILPR